MLNVLDDLRSGKMIVVLDLWASNYVFTMQKLSYDLESDTIQRIKFTMDCIFGGILDLVVF
jgi:hypothetical protein